ncbi:MAG TPA: hypothetical protein VFW71_00010 [Actinomycetota bacterium]|nr:hypothetical protein [Actinomycetota bacterium]
MKTTEWKRLTTPLLIPKYSWAFKQNLCYRVPVATVLLGVLAEGSSFDKGVYIWQVTMPLFVPADFLYLSWSERVGGGARKYRLEDPESLTSAVKTAMEVGDEATALTRIVNRGMKLLPAPETDEVLAYALTLLGRKAEANEILERAIGRAGVGGEDQLMKRLIEFSGLLRSQGQEAAIQLLHQWARLTKNSLKLETQ